MSNLESQAKAAVQAERMTVRQYIAAHPFRVLTYAAAVIMIAVGIVLLVG